MTYIHKSNSPVGQLTMASDGQSITGLWLEGQKYYAATLAADVEEKSLPVFEQALKWLDIYFTGKEPDLKLPLAPAGSEFRQMVWDILLDIPYGGIITYGEIAKTLASRQNDKGVSAQAVGGAVGHNPISIIIPCHRVVGTGGSLTGYAGGIDKKISLLKLEGVNMDNLFVPKKGTAL